MLDLPLMNIVEYVASFGCAAGATLLAFKKNLGWTALIIGCFLYGIIFFSERLYANVSLQIAFIILSIIGVINAYKNSSNPSDFQTAPHPKPVVILRDIVFTLVAVGICYSALRFSNDQFPLIDGTLSGCSLLAQYWMARKYAISWLLWLFTDAAYAVWFITALHLPFTGVLYIYLSLLSIHGYLSWKKDITL